MKNSGQCIKCGSKQVAIVPPFTLNKGGGYPTIATGFMHSAVKVSQHVCLECGYVEHWVEDSEGLRKLQKRYRPDIASDEMNAQAELADEGSRPPWVQEKVDPDDPDADLKGP